jgi:putative phosphoesterase
MKFLVLTDIHGSSKYLKMAMKKYEERQCEKILLLGDILYHGPRNDLPMEYEPKTVISILNSYKNNIISVKGNCDYDIDFLANLTLSTPFGKLYIQHRPTIPYNILQDTNIKIIINGHTHIPTHRIIENTHFINPGSVTYPRSSSVGTYMILNIDSSNIEVILEDILL